MHVVAVTRCKDEQDIVEPFVRHTLAFADELIVLDNGSTDRSVEILRALREEGVPLHLFQHRDEIFAEDLHSNWLFATALQRGADWVLFLDMDEFIHVRTPDLDFRRWLSATPDHFAGVRVLMENYHPWPEKDDEKQCNVVKRISHRWPVMPIVPKVFYRHTSGSRPVVSAGHHYLTGSSGDLVCLDQSDVVLSHFNARNAWQLARKAMIGWLRMEASGTNAKATGIAANYNPMFSLLMQDPDTFLAQVVPQRNDLVHDPLPYAGGDLRYTVAADERLVFIRAVSEFAFRVAQRHGEMVDKDPSVLGRLRERIHEVLPL